MPAARAVPLRLIAGQYKTRPHRDLPAADWWFYGGALLTGTCDAQPRPHCPIAGQQGVPHTSGDAAVPLARPFEDWMP